MSTTRQNETSHLQVRDAADIYVAALQSGYSSIVSRIKLYIERNQSRNYLAAMNDKMLDDIGISRFDAMNEVEKPFWKA